LTYECDTTSQGSTTFTLQWAELDIISLSRTAEKINNVMDSKQNFIPLTDENILYLQAASGIYFFNLIQTHLFSHEQ
jgi:hypothetical protein